MNTATLAQAAAMIHDAIPVLERADIALATAEDVAFWRTAYLDSERERAQLATLLLAMLGKPNAGGRKLRIQVREMLRYYAGTDGCAVVVRQ